MADLSKIRIPNGTEYNLKDAQARADITVLNGSLENNGLILAWDGTIQAGYYNGSGTIVSQTAQGEGYTPLIPVRLGQKIKITQTSAEQKSYWIQYATFDSEQTFKARVSLVSNVTLDSYESTITILDETIKYVSFMWRWRTSSTVTLNDVSMGEIDTSLTNDAVLDSSEFGKWIASNSTITINSSASQQQRLFAVPVTAGDTLHIQCTRTVPESWVYGADILYMFYGNGEKVQNRIVKTVAGTGFKDTIFDVTVPANADTLYISTRCFSDGVLYITSGKRTTKRTLSTHDIGKLANDWQKNLYRNDIIKSINHRGANEIAPENTMIAFMLSVYLGFRYIEMDIHFTSDGVPVVIHDPTINRTARNADGTELDSTINIRDITLEQALTYDFGIWKGQAYAGTKIPTLEEFLTFCRSVGVHPYLELKAGTEEQIHQIVDMVVAHGLRGNVTYIGFSLLDYVKNYDDEARLGYICSDITDSVVQTCLGLRTGKNEVFIDSANATGAGVQTALANRIPIEMWQAYDTSLQYVSGMTNDNIILGDLMKRRTMEGFTI